MNIKQFWHFLNVSPCGTGEVELAQRFLQCVHMRQPNGAVVISVLKKTRLHYFYILLILVFFGI